MLKNNLFLGTACVLAFSGIAVASYAQDASTAAPANIEQVVVTGSRLGAAGVDSPTPVTAVSAAQLQATAPSVIAEALEQLPSIVPSGGQDANAGSAGTAKNTLNLRGLGATRTLILLDGMRFPATANNNTVDTNLLPQALIRRVDITTGGASASYGSDAVAGAIDFVLNNHFEGLLATADGGISKYGDELEDHVAVSWGQSYLGGKLHLLASGDYFDNSGALPDTRPWEVPQANAITNTIGGVSTYVVVPNSRSVGSYTGYVLGAAGTASGVAAVTGYQFNNAGQLTPYNPGTNNNGSFQNGGDGVNTSDLNLSSRPLQRRTLFLRSEYDFSDDIQVFAEGMYGHTNGFQDNGEFVNSAANALTIMPDNPYLAPATAAQLKTLGVTSLQVTKYFPMNEFSYANSDLTSTYVFFGGFTGRLWDRFDWGVSGNFGHTHEYTYATNDLNIPNLKLAADVTVNPANGSAICRDTLTNPNDGCAPINVFGTGQISSSALAYITGTNPVTQLAQTQGAEAHINGPIFNLPAGPVAAATGVEYRRQSDNVISNAASVASAYQLGVQQPWAGGYDVTEGFVEFGIPVLGQTAISESLDLNLAARETYYSTVGGFTSSWKLGTVYHIVDDLTFRGTVSRDIRAPDPSELFTAGGQGTGNVTDPFNNNVTDKGIKTVTVGNTKLRPEKGTTVTLGFGYTPDWLPGLSATVDVYDIRVAGEIASTSAQNEINFCYEGLASYCPGIARVGGIITSVTSSNQNVSAARTDGVDLEFDYTVPGDDWFTWWDGTLQVRTLAGYMGIQSLIQYPGAQVRDTAAQNPHWRDQTNLIYELGDWTTNAAIRYIGAGLWNSTYNNPNITPFQATQFNVVNSATYLDLGETYRINSALNVSLNVNNVFDLKPQFSPSNSNYGKYTNEALYDINGRYFRLTLRYKL